ncbi:MAG: hypothetical protein RJA22_1495 [Verrucomicrobiota bacterium]
MSATILLRRDCAAVQIPHGTTVTLPQGTEVDITQTLGGSYTLRTPQGLFRLASQDADALGLTPEPDAPPAPAAGGPIDEPRVREVLRTCYDPEIPVNIVDLGLVYDIQVKPLPSRQARVEVRMTLTAPGCGMGPAIAGDAQQKLLLLDGVEEATVEIVWDPPWHQSMITPEGRRLLGLE